MDEKVVKSALAAQKKYFIRLFIAVTLVVFGVFIYDSFFTGLRSHNLSIGETEMQLSLSTDSGAYTIVIPYSAIERVEFMEDKSFDLGEMLEGVKSRKLWCGRWKNSELGEYELYADPKIKAWALVYTNSGVTLINLEDAEMTRSFADAVRDQLMPRGA